MVKTYMGSALYGFATFFVFKETPVELAWSKKTKLAFETRTHIGYSRTIKIAHLQ